MSPGRVRMALPWLQAALAEAEASATLPPLAALQWLAGRGRFDRCTGTPWREWLLEPVAGPDVLQAAPAGPTVAACRGHSVDGAGTWCLAQPVHLAAGLDHLRLAPLRTATPSDDEAAALVATIGAHFRADGLRVVDRWRGAWLLHLDANIECVTQSPETVVGHNVHEHMPSGRDGARVRSLLNEIQMLLHEHPVNVQRERARQLPVNGWWLWGFGRTAPGRSIAAAGWNLRTDDAWLRAVWGEHASCGLESEASSAATTGALAQGDTLIALSEPPGLDAVASLVHLESVWLAPISAQVRAGTIDRMELHTGDRTLALDGLARWRFWRRSASIERWLL